MLRRKSKPSRAHAGHGEASWAVSYVDMLTLLLCFFIIFFNAGQLKNKKEAFERLKMSFTKRAPSSIDGAPSKAKNKLAKNSDVLKDIGGVIFDKANVQTIYRGKQLSVEFPGTSFFKTGTNNLTTEGNKRIAEISKLLKPYKDDVYLVVQGHTDPRPVKRKRKLGVDDNWELSVLRATKVLKRFIKDGFDQQMLSAEGFAATKSELSDEEMRDLSYLRRITIKIEENKERKEAL